MEQSSTVTQATRESKDVPGASKGKADIEDTEMKSTSQLTPHQQEQLAEKMLQLKQQQQLQEHYLFQKYQMKQDYLRRQQQQELQNHLADRTDPSNTFKVTNGANNNKILSPEAFVGAKFGYDQSAAPRKEDKSSNVTSSEVKQRLQEFVLSKQQREAAVASASSTGNHFRQWYETSNVPRQHTEGDSDFPLRKAASEPNLKLKNRLKLKASKRKNFPSPLFFPHRDRAASGLSPSEKHFPDERRSVSPVSGPSSPNGYTRGWQRRERAEHGSDANGYNAEHALFSSPSMPNIQLGGNKGRGSPNMSGGVPWGMFGSSPNLMSHITPDHPLYNQYLMPQYLSNQQILVQLMMYHGKDPEDLHNLLARCLPNDLELANGLSPAAMQQARIKALIDAQYQVLAQFKGSPYLSGSMSHGNLMHPSMPRGHPGFAGKGPHLPIDHMPSLRESKSMPGLSPMSMHPRHELHLPDPHAPYVHFGPGSKEAANLQKQREQPARMALKEHLLLQQKEKQQATRNPMSLKEHFMRLEKQQKEMEDPNEEEEDIDINNEGEPKSKAIVSTSTEMVDEQRSAEYLHLRQREIAEASIAGAPTPGSATFPLGIRPPGNIPAINAPFIRGHTDSFATGLVYDTIMLKHQCTCGNAGNHPEHPGRLQSVWARLQETGVVGRCERVRPRKANYADIQMVHSEQHTMLFGGGTPCRNKEGAILKCFDTLPCGGLGVDADTIWNETHSANAVRVAAGCVIELAFKVATGELKNGFAIVRPPGHHSEMHQAMGFCYFNSIAIATKLLRSKFGVGKILIVDWDIHHGNGTQQAFYDDDHVMYISIHRHDDGMFFPGTGKLEECGAGIGVGYNVNVAFNGGLEPAYGDPEYLAAFRTIVMPIAREYDPDIVLVSAGFDGATGHSPQLGGYHISPQCFAYMTQQLTELANGRLVLALEGGYSLPSLCDSADSCIRTLLGEKMADLSKDSLRIPPNPNAIKTLTRAVEIQSKYWSVVKRYTTQVSVSMLEALRVEKEEADTVTALASLSMGVVKEEAETKNDVPMADEETRQ